MYLLKESLNERGMAFLMSKVKEFDKQTQEDISTGKKEFHSADFYIRKKLTGTTGIQDVIKETDSLAAGVTNIDKAKLYPGTYLGVTGIAVRYANSATTTADTQEYTSNIYKTDNYNPDAVTAGFAVPARVIPRYTENAEITIRAGGNYIYKSRLAKFFAVSNIGYAAGGNDENYVMLNVPKLIMAEKLISIQIEYGANAVADSDNTFIEVAFAGAFVGDRG